MIFITWKQIIGLNMGHTFAIQITAQMLSCYAAELCPLHPRSPPDDSFPMKTDEVWRTAHTLATARGNAQSSRYIINIKFRLFRQRNGDRHQASCSPSKYTYSGHVYPQLLCASACVRSILSKYNLRLRVSRGRIMYACKWIFCSTYVFIWFTAYRKTHSTAIMVKITSIRICCWTSCSAKRMETWKELSKIGMPSTSHRRPYLHVVVFVSDQWRGDITISGAPIHSTCKWSDK